MAITSRKLAATESAFALSIYAVAGPMVASAAMIDEGTWQSPDTTGWILFVLAGICSVITWTGIVGAYRRAAPAILAPFEYTALIGGAVAGYLIWNEVPDRYVVIGATIIIASGLFVVYREIGSAISRRWISLRPRR
jgi:drug/metabolite transporter (DMT)-like permease